MTMCPVVILEQMELLILDEAPPRHHTRIMLANPQGLKGFPPAL